MVALAYLVAAVCFILSLGGLSAPSSARRGNTLGIVGMTIAILATVYAAKSLTHPVIGTDARILRTDGTAIDGLYGAGNCVSGPVGQGYWGAGGTIGPALTFGFVAGRNAARRR